MQIERLTEEYKQALIEINRITVDQLSNASYYIPFTEKEVEASFDGSGKVILYGIMDDGRLAAVSGLFFDVSDLSGELASLGINSAETVEIGGCMTLPDYRNKGYMLALNKELLQVARQKGCTYVVATAHPDNSASNRSLGNAGMERLKVFYRKGDYLRNLYGMKL
ncbi:MAG: GNAT family N-acetyltransferase [Candidatus Azobacteroides sp.]|nr:GNAT family N-acetyltransferase [Candidatus Azobacteroides sp.]